MKKRGPVAIVIAVLVSILLFPFIYAGGLCTGALMATGSLFKPVRKTEIYHNFVADHGIDWIYEAIDGAIAEKLMADCPFYTVHTIPAGTYAGQEADVQTVTVKATLIVNADATEDDVYKLTAAIFDNADAITAENAKGAELSIENATSGMTVPFHAGAAKYFAEKGVTVAVD